MIKAHPTTHLLEAGRHAARRAYMWIALALTVAYLASGITIVDPGHVAIVRRCGRWVRTDGSVIVNHPGLLLAWPTPIDKVVRVPIQQEITVEIDAFGDNRPVPPAETPTQQIQESETESTRPLPAHYVLTGDQSIVQLKALARFRVSEPADYVVCFRDPKQAVEKIVNASITTTLNAWNADDLLRLNRDRESATDVVTLAARERLKQTRLGVELVTVEFNEISPPEQVRGAFLAVHEARVDQDALREEATVERAEQLLTAETLAHQFIADAEGKRSSRAAVANSEIALFEVALAAQAGPLRDSALVRMRQEAWRELTRQAKHVFFIPASGKHGILRLSLPEMEKSR